MTAFGPPVRAVVAIAAIAVARARSAASMTRLRGKRSPSTDIHGAATAAGIQRISVTIPTADAPPWRNAKTEIAMLYDHVPRIEPAQASSSRRRARLPNTAPNAPARSAIHEALQHPLRFGRRGGKIRARQPV